MLLLGDCNDWLKEINDNSIDLLLTDPPYGLEFMGKDWDKVVVPTETWKECYRVLKQGKLAFVMCSPRQDVLSRMIVNLQDAGFRTNYSSIYWTYACLSEDTEVLTLDGWEHFHNSNTFKSKEILCYNITNDKYHFETPQEWKEYHEIKDTLYRIKSDCTDQLVSKNHRCLVEREGKLLFQFAEELGQTIQMPYLENVCSLSSTFSDVPYDVKRRNLWTVLLSQLQTKGSNLQISSKEWEIYPQDERRKETDTTGANDGRKEQSMERRSNILQNSWKLCRSKIHTLSKRISDYGKERRLRNGASYSSSQTNRESITENGSSPSYRPQSREQQPQQSYVILQQSASQEIRTLSKSYKTTLATVTRESYNGLVFCPVVSTGAFVARRNCKIFLTGNSGFPKAANVSKLIDKKAGAEQEIIGKRIDGRYKSGFNLISSGLHNRNRISSPEFYKTEQAAGFHHPDKIGLITKPATEEAKKMEGAYVGFQPKPAVEVILVVSKGKTLTWLDDCRIPYQSEDDNDVGGNPELTTSDDQYGYTNHKRGERNEKGRFPANVVISDNVLDLATTVSNNDTYLLSEYECSFDWLTVHPVEKHLIPNLTMSAEDLEGFAVEFADQRAVGKEAKSTQDGILTQWLEDGIGVGEKRAVGNSTTKLNTDGFGSNITDKYQKTIISIIKTETKIIIQLATLNKSNLLNIALSMQGNERIIKSLMELNIENVSVVNNTNLFLSFTNGLRVLITDIVNHVARNILGNGKQKTIEKNGNYSRYFSLDQWADKTLPFLIVPKASKSERGEFNIHPTVKALKLMSYLITMGSREGDLILDPFSGSGTVLIAADQLHRKWLGIEMNPEYAEIIKRRLMVPLSQLKLSIF